MACPAVRGSGPVDSPVQRLAALTLPVVVAFGLACGIGYKPHVSVDQVAESRKPSRDLVRYLEQTSADTAVCDVNRRDGPSLDDWQSGTGAGLRFHWQSTIVRADYGSSGGQTGLYITFSQVF